MKRSTDRILTTHAGSLSRPANLIDMNRARASGDSKDDAAYAQCLAGAVADVVRRQRDAGVDIVDDGEFGKPMAAHYDYGVWWNYAFARMSGFVPPDSVPESKQRKSSVAAPETPARDQPIDSEIGCRNTASDSIAPMPTHVISAPAPTTTQP